MRKKLYACTAALFLAVLPLAACSSQSPAATETQPIASAQEELSSGSQSTSLTVTQTSSAEEITPSTGDSVEIASQPSSAENAFISEADAKKAAFDHAGVAEADVTGLRIKLDRDDGRQVYDVEFYSGSQEYDYEINAVDGTVLSFDKEMDDWARTQNNTSAAQDTAGTQSSGTQNASVSEADARSLALEQVPGAADENITKFSQDYDDGRTVYEIEIIYDRTEYDIEIDANTGEILKVEMD